MIKVLIADDEFRICELIRHLVRWEDYDMEVVGVALDGIEAIHFIEDNEVDLLITDIRMPGYGGLELIKKGREVRPDLIYLIISGYSQFSYAQEAVHLGVVDYLQKPVNKKELEQSLT
ncbi:MAG: response regulator, partial [Lachnospiraceae bacterium]|nr:response regulator [Lachnospiraceae bacterium]